MFNPSQPYAKPYSTILKPYSSRDFLSHGGIPLKSSILLLDFSFTIQLLGYPHNLGNHQAFQAPPAGRSISSDSPSSTARRGPPQRARRPGGNNLGPRARGAAGDEKKPSTFGGFRGFVHGISRFFMIFLMGFHWICWLVRKVRN